MNSTHFNVGQPQQTKKPGIAAGLSLCFASAN